MAVAEGRGSFMAVSALAHISKLGIPGAYGKFWPDL
jgi:hypothetical protein